MTKFILDKNYGYVLLAATAIGFECYAIGFAVPQVVRTKYFTKEFLEENFGEIHKREIGHDIPKLGYPDLGNGRYSQKLPYKAWFEFNNAQRAHHQFVENVGIVIPTTLIAGIGYPKLSAGLGASYFVGRLLYTWGYISKEGGNKREPGAYLLNFSFFVTALLAVATGFKVIRGV